MLCLVTALLSGVYKAERGLGTFGLNEEVDPISSEGGLNIDRGPNTGVEAEGVECTVECDSGGAKVGGVGLTFGGMTGKGERATGTDVCVVRCVVGCSSIARPPVTKPAGDGGTNTEGVPAGLGIDQVSDGGRKALRAPAAEGAGVPSVRMAIAPLRS